MRQNNYTEKDLIVTHSKETTKIEEEKFCKY